MVCVRRAARAAPSGWNRRNRMFFAFKKVARCLNKWISFGLVDIRHIGIRRRKKAIPAW